MLQTDTIRDLAAAAYQADELQFLLQNSSFRLIHDGSDSSPEAFELLCVLGVALLRARTDFLQFLLLSKSPA